MDFSKIDVKLLLVSFKTKINLTKTHVLNSVPIPIVLGAPNLSTAVTTVQYHFTNDSIVSLPAVKSTGKFLDTFKSSLSKPIFGAEDLVITSTKTSRTLAIVVKWQAGLGGGLGSNYMNALMVLLKIAEQQTNNCLFSYINGTATTLNMFLKGFSLDNSGTVNILTMNLGTTNDDGSTVSTALKNTGGSASVLNNK